MGRARNCLLCDQPHPLWVVSCHLATAAKARLGPGIFPTSGHQIQQPVGITTIPTAMTNIAMSYNLHLVPLLSNLFSTKLLSHPPPTQDTCPLSLCSPIHGVQERPRDRLTSRCVVWQLEPPDRLPFSTSLFLSYLPSCNTFLPSAGTLSPLRAAIMSKVIADSPKPDGVSVAWGNWPYIPAMEMHFRVPMALAIREERMNFMLCLQPM